MKILLIITGLGMGGAERQVCDLADQFANKGLSVLLISMTGETANRPQSTKVHVAELNMTKTLLGFIKAYWQARRLIKQFKPDVVHSHMVHANLFARLLRLSTAIPRLICTAHSSNEGSRLRMLAYRVTDSLCDLSTNVSQEAVDASVERGAAPQGRIIAMHNGVNTASFHFDQIKRDQLRPLFCATPDIPLILAVGRLTAAKDYPNLLKAFAALPPMYASAQLVIIGTGEEENSLKQLADTITIADRVHFLGLRRDVSDWMSAADIYVMSSAWEGMPLVLLEAMACQRVVVATDCGGVKEVLGDAGFLMPRRDSSRLSEAIIEALNMSVEEKVLMGKVARRRVLNLYSLSSICEKWLDIYNNRFIYSMKKRDN